jgi:hypothetical protein
LKQFPQSKGRLHDTFISESKVSIPKWPLMMKKHTTIHQNILPDKKYKKNFQEKTSGNFGYEKSFHSFAATYDDNRVKYKGSYTSKS